MGEIGISSFHMWICARSVVDLLWICCGFVVDLWWICDGSVVRFFKCLFMMAEIDKFTA